MRIEVADCQRRDAVPTERLARLARRAVRRLRIAGRGVITVSFIDRRAMQRLNWRFLRHRGLTDVLSFRYEQGPVVGEILIAPAFARAYAREHDGSYDDELARYLVHGLLHWTGLDDRTSAERRRMRAMEDRLLASCHA